MAERGLNGDDRGMRKTWVAIVALSAAGILALYLAVPYLRDPGPATASVDPGKGPPREIVDTVRKGESVAAIFEKHHLDIGDLFRMRQASARSLAAISPALHARAEPPGTSAK